VRVLEGLELAAAVRTLFETENELRGAVAFWGPEYSKLALARGAKVILDLSMGCTSKASLEALGIGPERVSAHALKHVRVLDGLHAKIFLGADRCILGSANASGAALGRAGGPPKLLEAAIEFERNDDPTAFEKVEGLWQSYLKASREVKLADYERAPRVAATSAARDRRGDAAEAASILQAVLEQPERFTSTAFAFGDNNIDPPELDEANAGYERELEAAPKVHRRLHICTTDPDDDVDGTFRSADKVITFWFGRGTALYAYHDIVRIEHDGSVSYYGRRNWSHVSRKIGLGHLLQAEAWQMDQKAARKLAKLKDEEKGYRYVPLSADALSEVLERGAAAKSPR
jgi:hypothetical protein